ncbi:MAG: hypothetical protein IAI48_02705, partial [Candidatus Eremiobacteraeota bacterium]|nr:hypothetical protein [Candidatus Eremiobacteraeota bacterium]
YISYENNVWLRQQFSSFVTYEPVLRHLGTIDAGGWVTLTLQRLNGEIFTMPIRLADRSASLVSYMDALHVPVPLFKMHPDKYYWSSTLPTAGVVFIQYNTCADDPQQSFTGFSKQVLATIDAISAKRVVIDLRQNGGGNSRIIRPLIAGLRVRQTRHLSVAVLIGPDSFSSAIQNAVELHQELGATLVGEATGGAASGYGEVKTLTLPNSHLIVQYTSKRFNSALDPSATGLSPQVLAPRLWTDALAGRDPALDAALTHGSD